MGRTKMTGPQRRQLLLSRLGAKLGDKAMATAVARKIWRRGKDDANFTSDMQELIKTVHYAQKNNTTAFPTTRDGIIGLRFSIQSARREAAVSTDCVITLSKPQMHALSLHEQSARACKSGFTQLH